MFIGKVQSHMQFYQIVHLVEGLVPQEKAHCKRNKFLPLYSLFACCWLSQNLDQDNWDCRQLACEQPLHLGKGG